MRANSSLLAHVAPAESVFRRFFCLWLRINPEGTLTVGCALWIFSTGGLARFVVAILVWYTMSLALMKRGRGRP